MAKVHVVLVCHTESGGDGRWAFYDEVQPNIDSMVVRVADATGKKPKMTYCVTGDVLADELDDLFRFVDEGHWVGIHSHLLGSDRPEYMSGRGRYPYIVDEDGVLNQPASRVTLGRWEKPHDEPRFMGTGDPRT
jgi:hypothetical protein